MSNKEIARVFEEIADILSLKEDVNVFRVRAYRRAARVVKDYPEEMSELVERGEDLQEIEGVGEDLEGKIEEMVKVGSLEFLEKLKEQVGEGLVELLEIEGLGPKSVSKFHKELGVENRKDLLKAAEEGQVRELEGFGEKSEKQVLRALRGFEQMGGRRKREEVRGEVESLVEYLEGCKEAGKVEVAGSYRRKEETVGDIDILVESDQGREVLKCFVEYGKVKEVLGQGSTKASVVLKDGLQVDVRVVKEESWGAAMQYFTGSKDHNIAIRKLAKSKGLKVNEYGVFKGKKKVAGEDEEGIYEVLGLDWIPPEERQGEEEVEKAKK